jgi:SOS-response transcriptional repressor LexA
VSTKEKEVYSFVRNYLIDNNGRSPSYDEIMSNCGISSKSNVRPILEKLVELGLLKLVGVRGIQIPSGKFVIEEDA